MLNHIISIVINVINYIIKLLGGILTFVFGILPSSPFKLLDNTPIAEFLPTLNYFLPISEIILSAETWLTCIGVYYLYQIVLRWIKAIE